MIKKSRLFLMSLIILTLCLSIFPYNLDLPTVRADSTLSGFNFFTNWTDVSLGVTGSYQEIDVSAYVPTGTTGVIIQVINTDVAVPHGYYCRKKGSTDDWYEASTIWTNCHDVVFIAVDSNYIFEMKIDDTDIDAYLIGYMDSSVTMFTDVKDYQLGTATAWTDIDLSSDVPSGATGVIMATWEAGQGYASGVRHPDSTDDFRVDARSFQYQICGVNSSRMIQGYVDALTVDHYLVGYTTTGLTYKTNWTDISLGVTGSWQDIDVTAQTSADATGVIVYMDNSAGWEKGNIQDEGSTNNEVTDIQLFATGQMWHGSSISSLQVFEGYISSVNVDFYIVAYTEQVLSNYVYPDHVETHSGGTNTTHTLLNNQTYGSFTASGWIVWDYGSTIENVTRITWDITHSISHSMFRIDSSLDGLSWTTVCQPQGKSGSPPTSTEEWTRYDSEMIGRFRYLRLVPVSLVTTTWYVDSVWLTIQPPAIDYSDVSYVYPQDYVNWNWEITGDGPIAVNYASQPSAMLGKNETADGVVTQGYNDSTKLVNADFDPDNQAVVMFDDFYNLTSVESHFNSGNHHVYLYMSTTGDADDWTLVEDWSLPQSAGWHGASINGTRIRYLKMNSTSISDNAFFIEAFRIVGVVHTGAGPPPDVEDYEWNFYLFPNWLADALGIPLLAGQLLASACVLACILLPFAFYERRSFWATIIIGLVVFAFLVALGWLPTWLMLLLALLIAGLFSFRFSKWFGGK